ncbi:MAG: hypothetical protein KF815_01315 [Rhodospirillales bacterium]|nr:hypothetical protein [Rhodospirillales bacterium]
MAEMRSIDEKIAYRRAASQAAIDALVDVIYWRVELLGAAKREALRGLFEYPETLLFEAALRRARTLDFIRECRDGFEPGKSMPAAPTPPLPRKG